MAALASRFFSTSPRPGGGPAGAGCCGGAVAAGGCCCLLSERMAAAFQSPEHGTQAGGRAAPHETSPSLPIRQGRRKGLRPYVPFVAVPDGGVGLGLCCCVVVVPPVLASVAAALGPVLLPLLLLLLLRAACC